MTIHSELTLTRTPRRYINGWLIVDGEDLVGLLLPSARVVYHFWRYSGTWCYKPHLKASCCPQYTIKYDYALHPSGCAYVRTHSNRFKQTSQRLFQAFQKPEKASEPVKPQLISELCDGQGTDGWVDGIGSFRRARTMKKLRQNRSSEPSFFQDEFIFRPLRRVPTKQGKGRKSEPVNLVELIHTSEWTVKDDATFAHKFEASNQ